MSSDDSIVGHLERLVPLNELEYPRYCEHFEREYLTMHSWKGHLSHCPIHGVHEAVRRAVRDANTEGDQ